VSGISNAHVSGALAGIIGVLVTIVAGLVFAKLSGLRRTKPAIENGVESTVESEPNRV
jgi:hypothetical protein